MRSAVLACVLAGCSFHPPEETASTDARVPTDAPRPPSDGTVTTDAPANVVPCSAPDPAGLVACFEFEDGVTDGVLSDSSPNHHDATTTGLAAVLRGSSQAASVGPSDQTYLPQSADLDRAAGYTVTMWVRPHASPGDGTAQGLVDHEQQYAVAVVSSGGSTELHCIHTNSDFEYISMAAPNTWSFVACTWDGTSLCAHRWTSMSDRDGFCHDPSSGPAATGSHGLALGSLSSGGSPHDRFDGDVDSIQLYARALTRAELCAVAGQAANCL